MTEREPGRREPAPLSYRSDLQAWLADQVDIGLDRLDMTQVELARRVGISPKHLSQLLLGRVQGALDVWDRLLREVGMAPWSDGGWSQQ